MRHVSKEVFLNTLVCPTLGWLMRHSEVQERALTLGERFRMEQGIEFGKRARELYPSGYLIEDADLVAASETTKRLMTKSDVSTVFEGTFLIDDYVAKADILRRANTGWQLVEVKSSMNNRAEFIDDMAYTAMVVIGSGVNVSSVSLHLISRDYRLGMAPESLFSENDHTSKALGRIGTFDSYREPIEAITSQPDKPQPKPLFECGKCELFKECLGKDIENPIFEVPRLSQAKFDALAGTGVLQIENIPNGFQLTENQSRVVQSVKMGSPIIGEGLKNELAAISWPVFYLDFESVMTAIPLYPGIAPYTQIPTQYSIHKCSELGVVVDHFEYLAEPSRDCRSELAETLVDCLRDESSIIVYSHFEKDRINELKMVRPDLSRELDSIAARLIDLEAIIRRSFYHPGFHGSISIKKTLPVLVPEMSYEGLEISEGSSASAAFAYLALGEYSEQEASVVTENLLKYCKQDTLALVELHRQLARYAN